MYKVQQKPAFRTAPLTSVSTGIAVGAKTVSQRRAEQLQFGNAAFLVEPAESFAIVGQLHDVQNATEIPTDGKPVLSGQPRMECAMSWYQLKNGTILQKPGLIS